MHVFWTASTIGVLNMRDCMDKAKNAWIADIEVELQKMQEADSGRTTDLNPLERARIRTKILDAGNRKKFEVYNEIVRLSGAAARERGYTIVERIERWAPPESGDAEFLGQIERRAVVFHEPGVDLTPTVLERLNREYLARKK